MALSLNPSRLRLTTAQWFGKIYRAGAGTVTSVDGDGGTTGLTLAGGPIVTTGTLTLGGTLDPSAGGTGSVTTFTQGSVVFAGAAGVYSQDNANLFWDDTNNFLGIGTAAPGAPLHIAKSFGATGTDGPAVLAEVTATAADANGRYGVLSNVTTSHVAGTVGGVSNVAGNIFVNGVGGAVTNITHYLAATSIGGGAGPVTTRYGLRVLETSGAGATNVINQYGLYVAQLTNATNNYAIYTAGTTVSLFNGEVQSPKFNGGILGEATAGIVRGNKIGASILTPIGTVAGTTIQTCGLDAGASVVEFNQFGNNTYYPTLLFRKGRNTMAAPSAVQSGDYLSFIGAFGFGATTWNATASGVIAMLADAAHTDASRATRIVFGTTPTGSTTVAERVRITPAGNVLIGTTTDTGSKLQVNGTVEVINGSGGGIKFADGSIQTTAVGVGGAAPSARLINTTAPLAGGGDLSADRTLSLAVTVADNGGAVALQTPPALPQSGALYVDNEIHGGSIISDTDLMAIHTYDGSTPVSAVNYSAGATAAASFVAQSDTGSLTGESLSSGFAGTGVRVALSGNLISNANNTAGLNLCAQAAAPIRFYTSGIAAGNLRASVTSGGHLQLEASKVTAGGLTTVAEAYVKKVIHRYDWTNAQIVALGAVTASSIIACTLPAKTVVINAYLILLTPDSSANALTVALGRTGALYVDYIAASDAKAAANTVYGNLVADRGANLTGWDLPSFTGTTEVRLRFVKTAANLDTVTGCTGSVYIETMLLP